MILRRRRIGAAFVCAGACLAASCGGGGKTVTTAHVVESFHKAGFTSVRTFSNVKAFKETAARQDIPADMKGLQPLNVDYVYSPSGGSPPLVDMFALRMPSESAAEEIFDRIYSTSARRNELAEARAHPKLYEGAIPPGFKLSDIRTARVCNVVLASYNPQHDAGLGRGFNRTLALLQEACR